MTAIASPCVLICSIDLNTGYCFGCGRTREEIAGWMDYTHDERARIMNTLEQRLAKVVRKPRRLTRRRRAAQRADVQNGENTR